MSKLNFFNDVAQGREAGNSAIRQFEDDRNLLSIMHGIKTQANQSNLYLD